MNADFLHTTLGKTGVKMHRLGLSASYRPGKKAIYKALDEGINFFFCYDKHNLNGAKQVHKRERTYG